MSGADGENDASLVPYKVGYAKPPEDSRFKKGRSGNPNGRPRKAKDKKPLWDPVQRPTDNLILEEAYRPVTIREGDKSIELPAIWLGKPTSYYYGVRCKFEIWSLKTHC